MNEFLSAFNNKRQQEADPGTVIRPFVGCPSLLSLAERQELLYRYIYLEDTVEALALHYRLSPAKVSEWLVANNIERRNVNTEEELAEFEQHVNKTYKAIQIRMLGLTALNTAKAWQALAAAEEDILASLVNAAKAVARQEKPDPRTVASLASTHERLVTRHEIIQQGMEKAGDIVAQLQEQLGWEIEVTHVASKPKIKRIVDDGNDENYEEDID